MRVYPIFLPPSLTRAANEYVKGQPDDRNPRFKRSGSLVYVRGGILRYSTTTAGQSTR